MDSAPQVSGYLLARMAQLLRARGRAVEPILADLGVSEHGWSQPEFDCEVSELVVAAHTGPFAVTDNHSELAAVLDRHISDVLDRLPASHEFHDRVRVAMARELDGGDPSFDRLAQRLAMDPGTVASKMAEQSVDFDSIRDQLRCQLARQYLGDPDLATIEVAFLLGYSELAAFHRAFKGWTGVQPEQFRQAQ